MFKGPHSSGGSGRRDKRLPVFVFPDELQFVCEDESTHKQVLTVYNPYEFNIRFQVLSNAPDKYAVVESQGSIKAHCCVDIVVRHKLAGEGPFDVTDKFRIDVFIDKKVVGRKQIMATLINRRQTTASEIRDSEEREKPLHRPSALPYVQLPPQQQQALPGSPSVFMIVVALLCLFVLLLPLEGESLGLPSYAHVSVNQKLIAAFALGIVTMAILKS